MIEIINKNNCCGCHACFNICHKNAIEMKEDEKGFLYPIVNKDKCINCRMCEKVCPIINRSYKENKPRAYACINKNKKIRMNSSSGGIFTLIAETIIESNGVIFGVQFDNKFNAIHSYIESKDEIYKYRGSKYVQSTIGDTFKKAENFLKEGRKVLFTGTPCQIEGLYGFLKKDYDNLYTQDIICHGVPSPKVWKQYKNQIEKENHSKIKQVSFRDKTYGWNNFSTKIEFENNKVHNEIHTKDIYMKAFLTNLALRDSCFDCSFRFPHRKSDIILADFWGIQRINYKMYDTKGVSLVIVNSKKGNDLFEKIKEKILFEETDFEEAIKYNKAMMYSPPIPCDRESFFKQLEKENLGKVVDKYVKGPNLKTLIKNKIKILISRFRKDIA